MKEIKKRQETLKTSYKLAGYTAWTVIKKYKLIMEKFMKMINHTKKIIGDIKQRDEQKKNP